MKKNLIIVSLVLVSTTSKAQLLDILKEKIQEKTAATLPAKSATTTTNNTTTTSSSANNSLLGNLTSSQISSGLKEALNVGVTEGVQKLALENGFYKNEMVKILMPEKLRKIDTKLRALGLSKLADQGVLLLNRAAEDAVSESAPIFANAITSMTFDDAKDILLGGDNSATTYLKTKTQTELSAAFQPKVQASLGKVGADKVWKQIITKYNTVARDKVTTDLNEYVTSETINGVFKMVADKENGIRNNSALRTTSLLQKVFGAQD